MYNVNRHNNRGDSDEKYHDYRSVDDDDENTDMDDDEGINDDEIDFEMVENGRLDAEGVGNPYMEGDLNHEGDLFYTRRLDVSLSNVEHTNQVVSMRTLYFLTPTEEPKGMVPEK